MVGLMDFLNSVGVSGDRIDFEEEGVEKAYSPFAVNNGLAQHLDTVLFAEEMNRRPWLSKEAQYTFFLKSVVKKKRYGKWAKVANLPEQKDVDALIELYQVNQDRAIGYLKLLSPEQIAEVHAKVFKGGSDRIIKGKKS